MALDQPAKVFATSTADDLNLTGTPFTLTGVYAPGKTGPGGETTWEATFTALPVLPLAATANFTEAFFIDEASGRRQINPAAAVGFIRDALSEDDARRFMELVHSKHKLVRLEVISEVVAYLTQVYTGRPTGAPTS